MADTIPFELMGIGGAEHFVTGNFRSDDLDHDITVREAHYKAVFGSIVFVLGLSDESLASIIIGFTGAATLIFSLVAAELMLGLLG